MLFFLFIFCLVILPPLFVRNASPEIFTAWSFPFQQLLYAYAAGMILRFFYMKNGQKKERSSAVKRITFFINSGYTLVTFGSLCVIAAGTELLFHLSGLQPSVTSVRPSSAVQYLFCVLDFAFASFFEEVLYRLYLPDMLRKYAAYIPRLTPRAAAIISESLSVALFAFAHRYLGAASVINAALACVALRICCRKSGSVWTNTAAHFAYNILSLILFTAV